MSSLPEVQKNTIYHDTYGNEFHPPDFTIKDICKSIPSHCYERDTARSLQYVIRDVTSFIVLVGAATFIPKIASGYLRGGAWASYAVVQGCVMTGLWVLGHECGHASLSSSRIFNDVVGFVLHSMLLVPYYSFKITHSLHHKSTAHMSRDMGFIPKTKSEKLSSKSVMRSNDPFVRTEEHWEHFKELLDETPLMTAWSLVLQQIGGWPAYLLFNVTGQSYRDYSRFQTNHILPQSPLFKSEQRRKVLVSDLGLIVTLSALYIVYHFFGISSLFLFYLAPYLVLNSNLVMIFFLQHTDPRLPHYTEAEWNRVRGACSTMDRDLGFIEKHLWHGISQTHVLHHFAPRVPFYHAEEATHAMRQVMGQHYRRDDTNVVTACWRSARMCQWVEDEGDVLFYRNAQSVPMSLRDQPTQLSL